jgi:hypothetical protein
MLGRWMSLGLLLTLPSPRAASPDPHALVDAAMEAMGGKARLAGVTSYRVEGGQNDFLIGNAERADGPFPVMYARFSELWDLGHDRLRRTFSITTAPAGTPGASDQVQILTDSVMASITAGRAAPAFAGFYEDYHNQMTGAPVQALLQAARSPTLRWEREVSRFGVTYDVVAFRQGNGWERIELARTSHLPAAVELYHHPVLDIRRSIFGDAIVRMEYDGWETEPNGLWWPKEQRFLFNGETFRRLAITRITWDAPVADDSFAVSDSVRAAFAANIRRGPPYFGPATRPEPVQPGGDIVRVADNWAMTLVKQPDGVVVFEAHLSDEYIKTILAEVARRWPGARVKAFVLTSDPWAHLGGVREVITQGIPIYVNGGSIPFLTALAKRPFTLSPDDLARSPRSPRFVPVNGRVSIGTGPTRIELFPVGGAYSERMTMAYFPERKLLYGADLIFPDRGASGSQGNGAPRTFVRTPAVELVRAVNREHLEVDSVFCVQAGYPIFAWKDFIPTGGRP